MRTVRSASVVMPWACSSRTARGENHCAMDSVKQDVRPDVVIVATQCDIAGDLGLRWTCRAQCVDGVTHRRGGIIQVVFLNYR